MNEPNLDVSQSPAARHVYVNDYLSAAAHNPQKRHVLRRIKHKSAEASIGEDQAALSIECDERRRESHATIIRTNDNEAEDTGIEARYLQHANDEEVDDRQVAPALEHPSIPSNMSEDAVAQMVQAIKERLMFTQSDERHQEGVMGEAVDSTSQPTSNLPWPFKNDFWLKETNQMRSDQKKPDALQVSGKQVNYSEMLFRFADRKDKALIICGSILAVLSGLGIPSQVLLFADIVDAFVQNDKDKIMDSIRRIVLLLCYIGVAVWLLTYAYFVLLRSASKRMAKKLRLSYFSSLISQDIAWLESEAEHGSAQELSSNMQQQCIEIQEALSEKLGYIQLSMAMSISGFLFAFLRGWLLTVIIMAAFPVLIFTVYAMTRQLKRGYKSSSDVSGRSFGHAEQALQNIQVVQAFGQEEQEFDIFKERLSEAEKMARRTHFKVALAVGLLLFIVFGLFAFSFYAGSVLVVREIDNTLKVTTTNEDLEITAPVSVTQMMLPNDPTQILSPAPPSMSAMHLDQDKYTGGDMLACFFGVVFGVFALSFTMPHFKAIEDGKSAAYRAFQIIDQEPSIKRGMEAGNAGVRQGSGAGKVELIDVSFAYTKPMKVDEKQEEIELKQMPRVDDDKQDVNLVLDSVSMLLEAGKSYAIVGQSGAGKSTIAQLVERFYDPINGSIRIDDQEIKDIPVGKLRSMIGYVGQEPILFNQTIRENVLKGIPDESNSVELNVSDDEIIECLRLANASFVFDMEHGLDTIVGNLGSQLSGGQKQRLAIARALIKRPSILIFDEATSALDHKSELEVQNAIRNISRAGYSRVSMSNDIESEGGERVQIASAPTQLIIAHRLSTVRHCDTIFVLKEGKLVEQGSHHELQQAPFGVYKQMLQQQEIQLIQQQSHSASVDLSPQLKNLKLPVIMEESSALGLNKKDDQATVSYFGKLMTRRYACKHWFLLTIGILAAVVQGAILPLYGVFVSKMLFVLNHPKQVPEVLTNELGQKSLVLVKYDKRGESDRWCLYMLLAAVAAMIAAFLKRLCFGLVGETVTHQLRLDLFKKMLSQPKAWFDKPENSPSLLTTILETDTTLINGVNTQSLAQQIEAIFSLAIGVGISIYFSWKMTLVCLIAAPLMILNGQYNVKQNQSLSRSSERQFREANLFAADCIQNFKTVATLANEKKLSHDFAELLDGKPNERENSLEVHMVGVLFGLSQFIQFAVFGALFYAGAYLHIEMGGEAQDILISIFSMIFGALSCGQAQQFGPDMGKAQQAAHRVFSVLDDEGQHEVGSLRSSVEQLTEEQLDAELAQWRTTLPFIEFRHVWFRYPQREANWVLKDFNLCIWAGEQIAITGPSGCGKSTISQLIMRFYDVQDGQVLVKGVDVRQYPLDKLRKTFGFVMQEPALMNCTILENILYGKTTATNSEVFQASDMANATEFISAFKSKDVVPHEDHKDTAADLLLARQANLENLKHEYNVLELNERMFVQQLGRSSYDTYKQSLRQLIESILKGMRHVDEQKQIKSDVKATRDHREEAALDVYLPQGFNMDSGHRGALLSGGQKQRIAIARALIRRPEALILDEATSALDEISQQIVQRRLMQAIQNEEGSDSLAFAVSKMAKIVIAHRRSTIQSCDRVVRIQNGQVKSSRLIEKDCSS